MLEMILSIKNYFILGTLVINLSMKKFYDALCHFFNVFRKFNLFLIKSSDRGESTS